MDDLTLEQLRAVCPHSPVLRLNLFVEPLNLTFREFDINMPKRRAHFLAQTAHESAGFQLLIEGASGQAYEPPSKLASRLGNTEPGDGRRFKGRGLIQVTGRKNYSLLAAALGLDCVEHPELLEEIENACRSAGWFWTQGAGLNLSSSAKQHMSDRGYSIIGLNLNTLADDDDLNGITLAINGGMNGAADRAAFFDRAHAALAQPGGVA